ncbi:TlpA family protein disulfide reductase [Flavicella sediminum]|uniref:TlpA family protein disulfide reductase n=1 Tax=Flavicella sediminum TaxID=2585141 RepID=UPI001124C1C1|nr:TlpA disulfide reductase family protein [Flavicella sediminum]
MKNTQKIICAILFLLSVNFGFSQKIIKNPEFGASSLPGEIRKLEILEDATVLHFHLHGKPGAAFYIPKGSCIKDVEKDEKLFVIKAEGIRLNKKTIFPEAGVLNYSLYFPPIKKDVGRIDFFESNKGGSWYVEDIIINDTKFGSVLPKALKGNWLKTDGSNVLACSFQNDKAIVDKQIWEYKSVKEKRNLYTLVLEKAGAEKVVYAKQNKDKTIRFGSHKKHLVKLSKKRTDVKVSSFVDEERYNETEFLKIDSTTYSGVLLNYSKRNPQKTGMLHVSNVFTGKQDSYLVKIKKDGSFSVKFPLLHPQEVYVRLPNYSGSVFVEQGKETWQLINSKSRTDVLFAGDLAQLNTDLTSLQFLSLDRSYYNLTKKIKEISLEEYKNKTIEIHEAQTKKFEDLLKTRTISTKAQQIIRLKLAYAFYQYLVSYDMYNRESNETKIDKAYLSFMATDIYTNKLAVMVSEYRNFVNRLRFCAPLRSNMSVSGISNVELAEILKEKGITLTDEEQSLIDGQLKFNMDNAKTIQKEIDFNTENAEEIKMFRLKVSELYRKMTEVDRKKLYANNRVHIDSTLAYLKRYEVDVPENVIAVQIAKNDILTKEEKEKNNAFFNEEHRTKSRAFSKKYSGITRENMYSKLRKSQLDNINLFFDKQENWLSDIIKMQIVAGSIKDELSPLSQKELSEVSKKISNSFLVECLKNENKKTILKLESNKKATGFVVKETPKTDGDKVFKAIIEKYEGKVVFVDFWATWCAPCRSGIKRMIPMKEVLKDKEVVFLYITDTTSPEKTYNNMIPGIKGEHYRVSADEWNYMKIKFNISGIPHHALVDKTGKIIEKKLRHQPNETYKKLIESHL